jgi:hypothetical protein
MGTEVSKEHNTSVLRIKLSLQTTLCHNPEGYKTNLPFHENLKTTTNYFVSVKNFALPFSIDFLREMLVSMSLASRGYEQLPQTHPEMHMGWINLAEQPKVKGLYK